MKVPFVKCNRRPFSFLVVAHEKIKQTDRAQQNRSSTIKIPLIIISQDSDGQSCPFCRQEIKSWEPVVVDPFDPKKTLPRNPTRSAAAIAAAGIDDDNPGGGGGGGGSPGAAAAAALASGVDELSTSMTTSISTPTFADMDEDGATAALVTPTVAFPSLGARRRDGAGVGATAAGDYARRGSDDDEDFEEPNTWTQVSPSSTLRPTAQSGEGGGGAGGGSTNSMDKNKSKLVNAGKGKGDGKRDSAPESDTSLHNHNHNNTNNNNSSRGGSGSGGDIGESPCASPGAARRSPPPPPVPPRKPTPSPSPLNSPGGSPPALRRPLPPPPPPSSSSSSANNSHGSGLSSHSHHSHLSAATQSTTTSSVGGSPSSSSSDAHHDIAASVAPPLPRARTTRAHGHSKETQTGKHGALKIGGSGNAEGTGSRPNSVDLSNTPPHHLPPPIPGSADSQRHHHQQQQQQQSHSHQQHDSQTHGPSLPLNPLSSSHSRESSSPRPAPPQPINNNVNNNYSKHANNTPPHHLENALHTNNVNNNATPPRPLPPEMTNAHEGPRHGRDNITPLDPPSSSTGAHGATSSSNGADNNGWADLMQLDSTGNSPPPFSPSSTTATATASSSLFANNNESLATAERSFNSPFSSSSSVHFDDAAIGNGEPPAVPMRKTRPPGQTNRSQVRTMILFRVV